MGFVRWAAVCIALGCGMSACESADDGSHPPKSLDAPDAEAPDAEPADAGPKPLAYGASS